MALPKVTNPGQSTTHYHGAGGPYTFSWDNAGLSPNPDYWRLRVGGTPWSWNYYNGGNVAGGTFATTFNFDVVPPNGKLCYTFVQYSYDGGTTWTPGDLSSFICRM